MIEINIKNIKKHYSAPLLKALTNQSRHAFIQGQKGSKVCIIVDTATEGGGIFCSNNIFLVKKIKLYALLMYSLQ